MTQLDDPRRAVMAVLQDLREAGVEVLPRIRGDRQLSPAAQARSESSPTPTEKGAEPVAQVVPAEPVSRDTPFPPHGGPFEMADSNFPSDIASTQPPEAKSTAATLEILAGEVAACSRCAELACSRTQTVFADGNPNARLVFLGEAPGADEDRLGKPFVGRAGKLLTDIIEKGMKLRRDDVYIMNILKCRPPGNRNPLPIEANNCRPFLLRQIELVDPEFICCLGAVAAQNLLQTPQPIGKMRGQFFDWRGIQVMCTYHPAYLLRNPSAKRQTWEDIQMLMDAMGS